MTEIESILQLEDCLSVNKALYQFAFQDLDLHGYTAQFLEKSVKDCLFLGCHMEESLFHYLQSEGNALLPHLNVPYNVHRSALYTKESLFIKFDPKHPESYWKCPDGLIYKHFKQTGKSNPPSILEALARRLHDFSITNAMEDFLVKYPKTKRVAIMGGHGILRSDDSYKKVTLLSKRLAERGYLLLSGGGPGAMEATHVGAWFAGKTEAVLLEAIQHLSTAPSYKDERWLSVAFELIEQFPRDENYESLGIPTWHYGHEPPTPFASHIAKYFDNSIREEGLLAIAQGGVIFSPGSAGTIQEIFQDAAQNHYKSFEIASPMVFFNRQYWTVERPIYPLLKHLSETGKYQNILLSITDEVEEVIQQIEAFGDV